MFALKHFLDLSLQGHQGPQGSLGSPGPKGEKVHVFNFILLNANSFPLSPKKKKNVNAKYYTFVWLRIRLILKWMRFQADFGLWTKFFLIGFVLLTHVSRCSKLLLQGEQGDDGKVEGPPGSPGDIVSHT